MHLPPLLINPTSSSFHHHYRLAFSQSPLSSCLLYTTRSHFPDNHISSFPKPYPLSSSLLFAPHSPDSTPALLHYHICTFHNTFSYSFTHQYSTIHQCYINSVHQCYMHTYFDPHPTYHICDHLITWSSQLHYISNYL